MEVMIAVKQPEPADMFPRGWGRAQLVSQETWGAVGTVIHEQQDAVYLATRGGEVVGEN